MAEISKKSLLQQIETDLNIRALNNTNSQVRRPGLYQAMVVFSATARQMLFILSQSQQGIRKENLIDATVKFIKSFESINQNFDRPPYNKIFATTPVKIANYIFNRFLNNGFFLSNTRNGSTSYFPAPTRTAVFKQRLFIRSSCLASFHSSISGAGIYQKSKNPNTGNARTIFGLPNYTVQDFAAVINSKNDQWLRNTWNSNHNSALPVINDDLSKQIGIIVEHDEDRLRVYPQDASNPIIACNLDYVCWSLFTELHSKNYELKQKKLSNKSKLHKLLNKKMMIFELPNQLPDQEQELLKLYSWPLFLINDAAEQNIYMVDLAIYHQLHDLIYGTTQTEASQAAARASKSNQLKTARIATAQPIAKPNQKPSDTTTKSAQAAKLPTDMEKRDLQKLRDRLDSEYLRFAQSFSKAKKDAFDMVIPHICTLNAPAMKKIFAQSDYHFIGFDVGRAGASNSKQYCLCNTDYTWGVVIAKDKAQHYVNIEHLSTHGILSFENYVKAEKIVNKMKSDLIEIAQRSGTNDYWTRPYTNAILAYEKTQPALYQYLQSLRANQLPAPVEIDNELKNMYKKSNF
ncbi:hypothetical protein [Limosilactobacillus mucosae]|jgi:hypothetical protein|uniref:hypothetical protein n=1 Tax=Limosilactobacillus mucosae TaxID=97478 RepID=UPI003EBB5933